MIAPNAEANAQLELDRFGIEVMRVKIYLWNGYRYSNATDALAAAKRAVQA